MFNTNSKSKSVSPSVAPEVDVLTSGWCCNLTVKVPAVKVVDESYKYVTL